MDSICVFCGSSFGGRAQYKEAAELLGGMLASRKIRLIYGGAKVGLMGAIADAVLAGGGKVTGVIPDSLVLKEVAHAGLTDLRIVRSMHERKALMADLADGFIALPGGFGTFEEFCEIVTWGQLGLHRKPCGLLNIEGYYDDLLRMFDHAVEEKLLKPENRALVLAAGDPASMLAMMAEYKAPAADKWITASET